MWSNFWNAHLYYNGILSVKVQLFQLISLFDHYLRKDEGIQLSSPFCFDPFSITLVKVRCYYALHHQNTTLVNFGMSPFTPVFLNNRKACTIQKEHKVVARKLGYFKKLTHLQATSDSSLHHNLKNLAPNWCHMHTVKSLLRPAGTNFSKRSQVRVLFEGG